MSHCLMLGHFWSLENEATESDGDVAEYDHILLRRSFLFPSIYDLLKLRLCNLVL
jgi:hypothetical protein